jgi:hypothetical protein
MKSSKMILNNLVLALIFFFNADISAQNFIQKGAFCVIASADYSYRTGYVWNDSGDYNRSGFQINLRGEYYLTDSFGFELVAGGGLIASQNSMINSIEYGNSDSYASLSTFYLKGGPVFNLGNLQFFLGIGADYLKSYVEAFGLETESSQIYFSYFATVGYIVPLMDELFIRPEINLSLVPFQEVYTIAFGIGVGYKY